LKRNYAQADEKHQKETKVKDEITREQIFLTQENKQDAEHHLKENVLNNSNKPEGKYLRAGIVVKAD